MNKQIKTFGDVTAFLEDKILSRDKLVAGLQGAADGRLHEFMRNDGLDLIVAVHQAHEASVYLAQFTSAAMQWSDEEKYAEISKSVGNFVLERAASPFADHGRSTSASVNLEKDAVKEFYIEFYQRLNRGY